MSGKAYTMREMKGIVDYILEHKAFGDIKGRKMWVDFSNTRLTFRTWQSLKETFLKRILPDIHNPYYKLTVDQIRSFKQGFDVEAKEKNKLEIVTLDESPISLGENSEEKEQPSTSHANNGEVTSGEDVLCSKVQSDRDSVDTVIIPTCYETAEDVQRALESPKSDKNGPSDTNLPPPKSLRDLITYSEPLTPMLQEVLDDFTTDEDSGDMRMQIVETIPDSEPQVVEEDESPQKSEKPSTEVQKIDEEAPIEIEDSEEIAPKDMQKEDNKEDSDDFVPPKVLSLKLKKRKGEINKKENTEKKINSAEESSKCDESANDISEICNTAENDHDKKKDKSPASVPKISVPEKSTSNISNSSDALITNSSDTVLPNNQEALENSNKNSGEQTENNILQTKQSIKVTNDKNKRKRANSQEVTSNLKTKKTLISKKTIKEKAVSDTDTIKTKLKTSTSANIKEDFVKKSNLTTSESPKKDNSTKQVTSITKGDLKNKTESSEGIVTDLSQINPCLKSVSLFAEQFNKDSYIDSESDHNETTSKDTGKNNSNNQTDKNVETINDVVILKSHSESESDNEEISPKKKKHDSHAVSKSQRNKVLANMFGFSSGAVGTKRKKRTSYRKNSAYRHQRIESSEESSEWTSESDSEAFVSPPRGRRNRHARKYLKPHSARIMSLEEEGGLFVMYGKKIYPLVKDGKLVKNYLTYLPESDPEEEENYWKLKYVEERKRVEELKKLVDVRQTKNVRGKSPILQAKASRNISTEQRSPAKSTTRVNKMEAEEPAPIVINDDEGNEKGKTLKITFAKNNQEVHVEGHWSNIHPVLAEVVQIFNKDTACNPKTNGSGSESKRLSNASSDKSSTVPVVDKEVHEKVNQLETEIFKEIEKLDQEEQSTVKEPELPEIKEPTDTNVTKRKRTLRTKRSISNLSTVAQISSTNSPSSPKRQKTSETNISEAKSDNSTKEEQPVETTAVKTRQKNVTKKASKTAQKSSKKTSDSTNQVDKVNVEIIEPEAVENAEEAEGLDTKKSPSVVTRRQTKTPKKEEKVAVTPKSNTKITRKSKSAAEVASPAPVDDDEEVRYMFPPAKKALKNARSALSLSKTKDSKRYMTEEPKIYSWPNLHLHSESTQGYQDSDNSPPKAAPRRKRKLSLTTALSKIRHRSYRNQRKSFPIVTDDLSNDSNSNFRIIIQSSSESSSVKSEAYKSDSYQLLLPQYKNSFRPLEKIDEDIPAVNVMQDNLKTTELFKETLDVNMNSDYVSSSNCNTDGNSSNVSLPLSPELSIVESLSINKDLLNSVQNQPALNDIHASQMTGSATRNKYLISQVDVSMPLMQQECNLRERSKRTNKHALNETKHGAMSQSLLNKINTVNIEEAPSLSESLDTRLRNLLLESAKKMSVAPDNLDKKDDVKEVPIKAKSGKRCSTPRKKNEVKRKLKITEPVVEEECTESCSRSGRKSCPPAIVLITEENALSNENTGINIDTETTAKVTGRGRKKKDVIKVKILRPTSKGRKERNTPKKRGGAPIHNDSGINETDSISMISNQGDDDSVDLIHNHSDTCLHANECMADSLEFIETSARSIISLNTDSAASNTSAHNRNVFRDCEDLPELFCQNAQDWVDKDTVQVPPITKELSGETVYHSPILSDTSLITEDLSDDSPQRRPSKWYLLSEDDTRTANSLPPSGSGFGANLRQIFPIACAVPDLSTITEMSGENSRKPTLEGDISTRQMDSFFEKNMNSN